MELGLGVRARRPMQRGTRRPPNARPSRSCWKSKPIGSAALSEPMYVMTSPEGTDVDVLVAAGEPESSVIAEAELASVFGVQTPVASLEHLLLMYLYSNQLKHLGDFARIVTEGEPDLVAVERYLSDVHPEMLGAFRDRVRDARTPRPAPDRPTRRRSRSR